MTSRSLLLIFAFLLTIQIAINGQITIGSRQHPAKGALLDLKEEETTSKGLGLPRVKLNTLKPEAGKLAESIGGNSSSESWDESKHIGLVVYNVEQEPGCFTDAYYYPPMPGPYVWNGSVWQPLFKEPETSDDVRSIIYNGERINADGQTVGSFTMSYTDANNNTETKTYYYASFGEAGIWMTQNLDTKYAPDGTPLKNSAASADVGMNKYNYAYPSKTAPTDATEYNANNNANPAIPVGLLYDWYTATNSTNCSKSDQGQVGNLSDPQPSPGINEVENKESKKVIKGICPEGWHLPSDRETNELEKELTLNAEKYANGTYTATEKTWEDSWEHTSSNNWRGTIIGKVMRSTTQVINADSQYLLKGADSKPAEDGGFNLYIVGYAGSTNAGTPYSSSYAMYGDFWTASSGSNSSYAAWTRGVSYEQNSTIRLPSSMRTFFPVRCKKDN